MDRVTNDEVKQMYEEMKAMFGERLPDPEHHPIQFRYYVKLFDYQKKVDNKTEA